MDDFSGGPLQKDLHTGAAGRERIRARLDEFLVAFSHRYEPPGPITNELLLIPRSEDLAAANVQRQAAIRDSRYSLRVGETGCRGFVTMESVLESHVTRASLLNFSPSPNRT